MMMLTKWLPICLIPEEFRITAVRNNVVHNRCRCCFAFFPAHRTQRMGSQKPQPCFLPSATIPTLRRGLSIRSMKRCMFRAVRLSVGNQRRAARMFAGCVWSSRHSILLSKGMKKGPVALGYWTSSVLDNLHYNTGKPPRQFRLSHTGRTKVGISNGNIGNDSNHFKQLELAIRA